jgi:hypothetical protein
MWIQSYCCLPTEIWVDALLLEIPRVVDLFGEKPSSDQARGKLLIAMSFVCVCRLPGSSTTNKLASLHFTSIGSFLFVVVNQSIRLNSQFLCCNRCETAVESCHIYQILFPCRSSQ